MLFLTELIICFGLLPAEIQIIKGIMIFIMICNNIVTLTFFGGVGKMTKLDFSVLRTQHQPSVLAFCYIELTDCGLKVL